MALGKRLINTGAVEEAVCNTESVQPFGADNAYSSNIALYELNSDGGTTNNVPDTTTNYNGTASNITYTSGYIGNAAVFNGTNSVIALSTTSNPFGDNDTIKSVSAWVKLTTTSSKGIVYTVSSSTNLSDYFTMQVRGDSNEVFIAGRNGSSSNQYLTTTSITPDTNWHHYVFQLGSSSREIYIDGVKQTVTDTNSGSATSTSWITYPSYDNTIHSDIGIGRRAAGYQYFADMTLDQVRIFNKALTADDIATLYAETSSTASNTNPLSEGAGVALYSLDYDASEASGYYDAEISSLSGVDFGVGGKTNTGVKFSANNAGFSNSNLFLDSTAHSVSLWIKPQDLTASKWQIIYFSNHTGHPAFTLGKRPDKTTSFHYRNESSSEVYFTLSNADVWYHIVVTRNNSGSEVFVNGSSVATDSNSMGTTSSSGYNLTTIGSNPLYSNEYFDGSIDQIRVFSKVLSSDEIATLYNSGNGETACVHTTTANTADFPTGATAVAHYPLDNNSLDNKGTNDGSESGSIEYRFGKYGQAAVFDGSSHIDVDSLTSVFGGKNTVSVSLWFNTITTARERIFSDYAQTSRNIDITIDAGNIDIVTDYGSATAINFISSDDYNDGNWHHIVVAINQSTSKRTIYIDNILQETATLPTPSWDGYDQHVTIGGIYAGGYGQFFNGKIDQVRVYSSAITSSQVTELYNEKPETDTSNFKTVLYEGTGSTQYISNVGMDLETSGGLVWTKRRNGGDVSHALVDSLRTISPSGTSYIASDETNKAATSVNMPSSFEANGFFVKNGGGRTNSSGHDFVSWIWLGAGEAVSNSNGSIASSVTANTNAGFSIAKWTGDNSSATIGHGLSSPPEVVIRKPLDTNASWAFDTTASGTFGFLFLDTTANFTAHGSLNAPTSTVFSTGGTTYNKSGEQHLAYLFHSVAGYSRISTYPGSGNSQTIYVTDDDSSTGSGGFQPSWIMIKNLNSSSGNWMIYDAVRDTDGTLSLFLEANTDDQEATASTATITPISNGFTIGNSNSVHINDSSDTYVYMAFK